MYGFATLLPLWSILPSLVLCEPTASLSPKFVNGFWKLVQEGVTGVSAMQLTVVSDTKAIVFDKMEHNPLMVNGHNAWASEVDLVTKSIRPLNPLSNTFCASGSFLSNGTFVHSAGNPVEVDVGDPYSISGLQSVRLFTPCDDENCDIIENPDSNLRLTSRRWYPASLRLEDGSVLIFGGSTLNGFINNATVNNPTFEFFPPKNINGFNGLQIPSQFLRDTLIANQFPTVMSLPNGKLFVVANQQAMLFDWKTNVETPLPRIPNGVRISYPFSGGVVMLPLTIANNFTPEIFMCGGSTVSDSLPDIEYSSQTPSSTQCARMVLNAAGISKGWQVEHMPQARTMVELILLPDQRVLLVNGVGTGVGGFNSVHDPVGPASNADHPVSTPLIYDPSAPLGNRFSSAGMPTSSIPRLYHSVAILLPDASIMIAGSNPNPDFITDVDFPTEYRMEFLSPPYMAVPRPSFTGLPASLDFDQPTTLNVDLPPGTKKVTVALIDLGFATHTVHMDHKFVELRSTLSRDGKTLRITGPANARLFSPGPGFIYVVTDQGVPSVGKRIMIGPPGAQPPVDPGAVAKFVIPSSLGTCCADMSILSSSEQYVG
ncbi:hypothetical protein ONZ45_g4373 [Pleurotus djamor]|nr:hypothetical protein ONZ45_g4373 [Pleurotus djamor]